MAKDAELWTTVSPEEQVLVRRMAAALGVSVAAFVRSGVYRQIEAARAKLRPEDLPTQDGRVAKAREALMVETPGAPTAAD